MAPVFAELNKIRGKEPFGEFNWKEVRINRRLREEDPTIVDIVEAHEKEHEKDYGISGVNAQDDLYFEPRAHLAALRKATSGNRRLTDLHAKTKMGADVIEDLVAINAEFQERCQACDLPPTYEADMNRKSIMTHVLWEMRKRSDEERKRIIRSKLIKAFAGTIILAVAGFYISMGAVYAPGNQNSGSTPLPYSTPEATLAQPFNTPRVTTQFTQTPTIVFQDNRCVPVKGNFDQSVSVWKTINPGREPYYYGEVNQIGEKGTPCR